LSDVAESVVAPACGVANAPAEAAVGRLLCSNRPRTALGLPPPDTLAKCDIRCTPLRFGLACFVRLDSPQVWCPLTNNPSPCRDGRTKLSQTPNTRFRKLGPKEWKECYKSPKPPAQPELKDSEPDFAKTFSGKLPCPLFDLVGA